MPYVPKPKIVKQRRVPVQARAIERVNKILDTAARLMSDPAHDKVTTHLIAEHAEVSVGSVYQFFPNVESVKIALIERLLDRYYVHFDATLADKPQVADLGAFSAMLVDVTHDFYKQQPEVVALMVAHHNSEEFSAVNAKLNQRVQARVLEYFADKRIELSRAELLRKIGVVIAISDVMTMCIWSAEDTSAQQAYLQDWRSLVAFYSGH